jgi:hypothetical protein
MESVLSGESDEDLVQVAAKMEIILIYAWLGGQCLNNYPSILLVNCQAGTLLAISKH